jgi:hypothetical protein
MSDEHRLAEARVVVLIPCFNEQPTIADVVTDSRAALPDAAILAEMLALLRRDERSS